MRKVSSIDINKYSEPKIKHVKIQKPIVIPREPVIITDKQKINHINKVKSICRKSMEYSDLMKFLKDYMNMGECEFFSGVSEKIKKGMIQIHHEPFDLFTIINIVYNKHEKLNLSLDELSLAYEVIKLHYQGLIGLIPLSVTVHELVTDNKGVIPLNCVYGNFIDFVDMYYEYIDSETKDILIDKMEASKNIDLDTYSILNVEYIYSETEGVELPEKIDLSEVDVDVSFSEANIA